MGGQGPKKPLVIGSPLDLQASGPLPFTNDAAGGSFDLPPIFEGAENGAFYDLIQSEHRETDALSPLVTEGNPVGWAQDLSGNGKHWTQPTASYRCTKGPALTTGLHGFNTVMNGASLGSGFGRTQASTTWAIGYWGSGSGVHRGDLLGGFVDYVFLPKTDIVDGNAIANFQFNGHHIGFKANSTGRDGFPQNEPMITGGRWITFQGRGCYERLATTTAVQKIFSGGSNGDVLDRRHLIVATQNAAGDDTQRLYIPGLGIEIIQGGTPSSQTANIPYISLLKNVWDYPCNTRTRNRTGHIFQAGAVNRILTESEIVDLHNYGVANYGIEGGILESL